MLNGFGEGVIEQHENLVPDKEMGHKDEEEKECCSKAEVLLVDDILFNLIPLTAIVESTVNKKCDEASDGLIAVDMYYRNMTKTCCNVRYRLILTDIQMPNMDGI